MDDESSEQMSEGVARGVSDRKVVKNVSGVDFRGKVKHTERNNQLFVMKMNTI